jgi:tetratricopeptide (TPR) repeat protein
VVVTAVVAVVIGAAVWALVAQLSSRLPGETVTGSVTLSASQQTARTLAQAQTLENEGDAADAVKLYQSVLQRQPNQEEALAEVGWLEYEAGAQAKQATLLARGQRQEQKAESIDRRAFAPHLYLGSMFLAEGRPGQAVAEYRQFLADHPPRATVVAAAPFVTRAFSAAHQPVPPLPLAASTG